MLYKKDLLKHLERMKKDPIYNRECKSERERDKEIMLRKQWDGLDKFVSHKDVPELPMPLDDYYIKILLKNGAIDKRNLVHNKWYYGNYRNSNIGKWDSIEQEFSCVAYSMGYYFIEKCKHFRDDDKHALFTPLRLATDEEIEDNLNKLK